MNTGLTIVATMNPGIVYVIHYRSGFESDDSIEENTINAFWTGEIDTWGKYTIQPVNGSAELYLFAREFVSLEPRY